VSVLYITLMCMCMLFSACSSDAHWEAHMGEKPRDGSVVDDIGIIHAVAPPRASHWLLIGAPTPVLSGACSKIFVSCVTPSLMPKVRCSSSHKAREQNCWHGLVIPQPVLPCCTDSIAHVLRSHSLRIPISSASLSLPSSNHQL
jgi:hypothetical protein